MFARFFGLLQREWRRDTKEFYLLTLSTILIIWFLPLLTRKVFIFSFYELVLVLLVFTAMFYVFLIPFLFANSIRKETQQLDLWLHTEVPFWQLLFVKSIYYLLVTLVQVVLMVISTFICLAQLNVTSLTSFVPIIFFLSYKMFESVIFNLPFFALLLGILLFFKRYIGRFSYLITIILFILFMRFNVLLYEFTWYKNLMYTGDNLASWIPMPSNFVDGLYDVIHEFLYVREIYFGIILFVLLLFISTYSLEKVLKR
ncbi:hypothetical protein [Kurthia gibsonii]|uniref:hypothetical protein n=2 Tax=Kurthia TaxID=1649 RepID=UPI001142F355|nr:hypothetical protein [Kurthia gibsonii]